MRELTSIVGSVLILGATYRFGPINFGDWPFYVVTIGIFLVMVGMSPADTRKAT